MPETKLEDARIITERLRYLIAHTPIETEIGPITPTISIGVALVEKSTPATIIQLLSTTN